MSILTNTRAIDARATLNLSQAKVAKDIGLSRAYLSQFESGKRILEDRWLQALSNYYEELGWGPDAAPVVNQPKSNESLRVRDGFQIVAHLSDAQIEELLNEYYDNQVKIDDLSSAAAPKGMFLGLCEERASKTVFELMCLTCLQDQIIRALRGHDSVIGREFMRYRDVETIGQYAGVMITEALGSDVETEPDSEKEEEFA